MTDQSGGGGADMPFEALLSGAFWGQFMLLLLFGTALIAIGVACGLAVARLRYAAEARRPDETLSEIDIEFMNELLAHDKEAVRMARLACRQSHDPAVRALALDVVAEQCQRIGRTTGWLELGADPTESEPDSQRRDTGPLLMLRRTTGQRFDVLFLEWLLRNREEAAVVAEDIEHTTTTPVVASLAEDILDHHARQRHLLRGMAAERTKRSHG